MSSEVMETNVCMCVCVYMRMYVCHYVHVRTHVCMAEFVLIQASLNASLNDVVLFLFLI